MSPTLLSSLALLFVSFTHNANAGWRCEAANLLYARMDPLVNPNGVASHVHNVVGGSKFSVNYDYERSRQSNCTTACVPEDKSNYWAPALYYKHRDTGRFEHVPGEWGVYYHHRGTENKTEQFPPGFRMIAGDSNRGTVNTSIPEQYATTFFCRDSSQPNPPSTPELPKRPCDQGVFMHIIFPACWNGIDVTSANFKDHVSYPVGTREGGTCPSTHPVRIMTIRFEQMFHTELFEYYDGAFVLSTGDNVGYSSHGDFTNGWDASQNSILQQAINTCTDEGNHIENCPILQPLLDFNYHDCRPESLMPVEDVGLYGGLKKLPGDNPIWGGNVTKVLTGVSSNPPFGSPFTTLPSNWVEYGCINGGDIMTGDKLVDQHMYPGLCIDHCNAKGFSLAGLAAGNECHCADTLTNGGKMELTQKRECNSVCGGSLYEFCGASDKINLYKQTGKCQTPPNGTVYPPVGSYLLTQEFPSD